MSTKKRTAVPGSGSYSKKQLSFPHSESDLELDGDDATSATTAPQRVLRANDVQSDGSSLSSEAQAVHLPAVAPNSLGINRDRFVALSSEAPSSPQRLRVADDGQSAPVQLYSPGGNRDRFHANCQPLKVCCDLSTVGLHNANTRFSMQAIVLIVYPSSEKPERRHLQLIDSRGTTGLTVWGPHVNMFVSSSVGQVVRFTKLSLTSHNGVKGLTMSRDSTVTFINDVASALEEAKWWTSLLDNRPLRIIEVHDRSDDDIVSVSAILGTLWSETKKVAHCCTVLSMLLSP